MDGQGAEVGASGRLFFPTQQEAEETARRLGLRNYGPDAGRGVSNKAAEGFGGEGGEDEFGVRLLNGGGRHSIGKQGCAVLKK
jgi:hypothetical protein